MPRPVDRRGRLIPEHEYDEMKEQERQARIDRFVERAGSTGPSRSSRDVIPLDMQDDDRELPSTRPHDPHTLEASRARLVEALNSRG